LLLWQFSNSFIINILNSVIPSETTTSRGITRIKMKAILTLRRNLPYSDYSYIFRFLHMVEMEGYIYSIIPRLRSG